MIELETEETLLVEEEEEQQAVKLAAEKQERETLLSQMITEEYAAYTTAVTQMQTASLEIENRRIRLGNHCIAAKESVGHGSFKKWLAKNCPTVSYRTLARCMGFSKATHGAELQNLDEVKEYNKVLTRLGFKDKNKGHGRQELHEYSGFAVITKAIASFRKAYNEVAEKEPLEEWDDDAKEQLKQQLEWAVALYEEL